MHLDLGFNPYRIEIAPVKLVSVIAAVGTVAFACGLLVNRVVTPQVEIEARLKKVESAIVTLQGSQGSVKSVKQEEVGNLPALIPSQVYQIETQGSPSLGPADAPITIVEFSDFECPYCKQAVQTKKRILEHYGEKIRLVFKHNPLSFHSRALSAHKAAIAAAAQGKFWPMHDLIFENQKSFDEGVLRDLARRINLDLEMYDEAFRSANTVKVIGSDQDEAHRIGARGTPTFFINGRPYVGALPYETFEMAIDGILKSGAE